MLINQFRCFLQSPALAQLVRILLTKDMRAVSMPSSSQNCCFGIAGLCARVVQPSIGFCISTAPQLHSFTVLRMSRLGSCALLLLPLLPTADTAGVNSTVAPKDAEMWGNFVFCKCGLTCETQPGTFFGQSCACHACTNGTIGNSTGLRGALNSTSKLSLQSLQGPAVRSGWSPSSGTPQILECRCGRYCSYGRQLGGGRGGTYFCFVFACRPCR
eukprot:s1016_g3.t2